MSIKASEISDLIKARIDKFQSATEARNVGTVVSVTDGIVRIHGLADARYGEMLEFVGNTSKTGGETFLLNRDSRDEMERLVHEVEVVELANSLDFDKVFVAALPF